MATTKIKLLLIGIVCSVMPLLAQTEQNLALLITKSDGASIGYCLEKFPVLTFEDLALKISSEGVTETFLWKEIASLSYVKESYIPSQILNQKKENLSIIVYEDGLSVYSGSNHPITVYDVNGKIVYSKSSQQNTFSFIKYSQFSHGFYILKSGNNNYKFYAK